MKKRVKRTFSIHHWVGLPAGIFLLVASITGSILVFHNEIDHTLYADIAVLESPAAELKIDHSLEQIRRSHPGADIRVPDFPEEPEQALKYEIREGKNRKWIFVQPETGTILGEVERADQRLVHILLDLHYNLLSGTVGKIVVLLGGLALIILSITGFLLYRKSIFKVLSFRQKVSFKNRRSFFSSLHRIVGVWSLVFNLLISITGSWIAYTIVESALSSSKSATSEVPAYFALSSVDTALQQIRTAYPGFDINYLLFPKSAEGKLSVLGSLEGDPAFYGRTSSKIEVDMRTGKIDKQSFLRDAPWHQRAIKVLKPLHFGDYAGLVVKAIYSFFGILPGILAISGFLIWRNRKLTKPIKQKRSHSRPLAHSNTV